MTAAVPWVYAEAWAFSASETLRGRRHSLYLSAARGKAKWNSCHLSPRAWNISTPVAGADESNAATRVRIREHKIHPVQSGNR